MSLQNKKSALFGKEKSTSEETNKSTLFIPQVEIEKKSQINVPTQIETASSKQITKLQEQKKLEEIKVLVDKAINYLKTSLFNWSPDYLAAAPCYEKASEIYKGIQNLSESREMMVKSAECYQKANCLSSAGLCYSKAALIAKVRFIFF
jgi:hypothetical protein